MVKLMGKDGFFSLALLRKSRPCHIQCVFHSDIPTDLRKTSGIAYGKFLFPDTCFLQSPVELSAVNQGD